MKTRSIVFFVLSLFLLYKEINSISSFATALQEIKTSLALAITSNNASLYIQGLVNLANSTELSFDTAGDEARFTILKNIITNSGTPPLILDLTLRPFTAIIPQTSTVAVNVGTGDQILVEPTGTELQFRTLTAGSNIVLTQNANDINIATVSFNGDITTGFSLIQPTVWITPNHVQTDIGLTLLTKGTGPLTASIPDNTAVGGNVRGNNAVDWQMIRALATQAATGNQSVIGGGANNTAAAQYAAVFGGNANNVVAVAGLIGGGQNNIVNAAATNGVLVGGSSNKVLGQTAALLGGTSNTITSSRSFIGAGTSNTISSPDSVVAGGSSNTVSGNFAIVVGGSTNSASGNVSCIGGGDNNLASALESTVGGGNGNTASGVNSYVGGGITNVASGIGSTTGGGITNTASGIASVVIGGSNSTASGQAATVAGGAANVAAGDFSFAAGSNAQANNLGSFVLTDSNVGTLASSANNQMQMRFSGGTTIWSNAGATLGVSLAANATAWAAASDKNLKENFEEIDKLEILEKLAALPITQWNYKGQDASVKHIGPMAQDFWPAFNLGNDSLKIETLDADGIALASIQGVYQLYTELKDYSEIQEEYIENLKTEAEIQRKEISELKMHVEALKVVLNL